MVTAYGFVYLWFYLWVMLPKNYNYYIFFAMPCQCVILGIISVATVCGFAYISWEVLPKYTGFAGGVFIFVVVTGTGICVLYICTTMYILMYI